MKSKYSNFLTLGVCVALLSACDSSDGPNDEVKLPDFDMNPVEASIAVQQKSTQVEIFSDVVTMLGEKDENSNLIFSPLNATMALSVLANASDNYTADIINDITGCSNLDDLNSFNARLLEYLPHQPKGCALAMANGFWYNNMLALKGDFVNSMSTFYDCMPVGMNFSNDSYLEINKWVADHTNNLINSVANASTINSSTQVYIASAMYYKGKWETPFSKSKTRNQSFHGTMGDSDVPTMSISSSFNYAKLGDGTQMVEIPFKGKRTVLTVVLPPEDVNILDFAARFSDQSLEELQNYSSENTVNLSIPKFKLKHDFSLNDYLSEKGIDVTSFNLERATDLDGLLIKANHYTTFEIDEDGAVMSATTTIGIETTAPGPPVVLDIDRPFVFFVNEKTTGSILMGGVIRNL